MNYRPIFILPGAERAKNGQVFATREEAAASAADRFMRWTAPTGYAVEETTDPVTFTWSRDEGDRML